MNKVTSLEDNIYFKEIIEEFNYLFISNNHVNNNLLKEKIIFILKKLLRHKPGTIGVLYNNNSLL